MTEIIFQVEEDRIDGGWVARALGESIVTQADSIDDLKRLIRDALLCHFENESDIPPVIRLHFVKDEVFNFFIQAPAERSFVPAPRINPG